MFACQLLCMCCIGLTFGIWATVLLSNNGFHSGTSAVVVAYIITDCVLNYIRAIDSVTQLRFITNKVSKRQYVGGCLGLGIYVWNCVLLFHDIGVDRISENSYYIYIFVSFMMNTIALGIAVCAFFITIRYLECLVSFDKDSNMPEIQINGSTLGLRQSTHPSVSINVTVVSTPEDPLPPV